ncbi:hypothetical protein IFR05_003543 [Cadophora sp. M221]|nr:hypothetical protein IFR05_003543 [Cadophora sp. M221]
MSSPIFSPAYSPLKFPDEIRLLVLQPARLEYVQLGLISKLEWQIKHVRLSQNPRYEALSYVWEQDPFTDEPNATLKQSTTNLSRALEHLRTGAGPAGRVLWIDALCINQKDVNERNHQVTQMGEIYSRAESVILWLGEGNSATGSAIRVLSAQSSEHWIVENYYKPPDVTLWIQLQTLMAFRALCRQKYWTRLWIIQEVLLATNIELQWGDEVCQWSQLCWFVESIGPDWLEEEFDVLHNLKVSIIEEIRLSMTARLCRDWVDRKAKMSFTIDAKPVFSSLIALCSKYGGANCGDPKDKIFGLHSLAESCCRAAVPVDYILQLPQVHRQVLEHCMTRHERWDSIIGASQEFHEQLRISISEYLSRSGRHLNVSDSHAYAQAVGYSTSSVLYTSGPNFAESEKIKSIPITRKSSEELFQAYRLRYESVAKSSRTQLISRQFKLAVSAYPQHSLYPIEMLQGMPTSPRSPYKLNREDIQWILNKARGATMGVSMTRTRIAVSSSGVIYFVPSVTRPGDIFCRMPSSSIVLIARESIGPGHDLIGRAIPFISNPAEKSSNFSFSPLDVQQMKELGQEVTLHLSLETLQMMTAWSTA